MFSFGTELFNDLRIFNLNRTVLNWLNYTEIIPIESIIGYECEYVPYIPFYCVYVDINIRKNKEVYI